MNKVKTRLIASCGTLERLEEEINNYFYSATIKLTASNIDNQWDVIKAKGSKMEDYRVILKKNRYRFELLLN